MAAASCSLRELTIYAVGELHPQWLRPGWRASSADAADAWAVDAAAVGEVDAAGVQLLLSLANLLARDQRRLPRAAQPARCSWPANRWGSGLLTRPPAPASSATPVDPHRRRQPHAKGRSAREQ